MDEPLLCGLSVGYFLLEAGFRICREDTGFLALLWESISELLI